MSLSRPPFSLAALVVGATVICIAYGVVIALIPGGLEDGGRFGESFGAVSALFSAVAFAGVVYGIWLQRREMAHTVQQAEKTSCDIVDLAHSERIVVAEQLIGPEALGLYGIYLTEDDKSDTRVTAERIR